MDPIALSTFAAVARQGSVSAAAQELHTVQSNVTARLKQLEAELGVPLFTRHSRGMLLTEAGTRLLGYARRLSELADEARAAVRDDGRVQGSLRLGSMETTAAVRLPAVLGRFHREHPDVQLDVRTGPTAELLDHVLAHRLDAALVAGPIDHPDLQGEAVFREELVLVSAREGRDIEARLREGGLTAIMFRQGCSYRQRLETHFSSQGWLPFRRLEFGTLEGALGCVGAGIGVTVLPRSAVEGYRGVGDLKLQPLGARPMWVETLLVRRRDAAASATLRSFVSVLKAGDAPLHPAPRKTPPPAPGRGRRSRPLAALRRG
ncbi:MAG TPA: LysR substrate-binding domain-containing protein [Rhizobacter sp.]|nr:LysR substrate-binding domain-containing protein [Rhizobacter sp.]